MQPPFRDDDADAARPPGTLTALKLGGGRPITRLQRKFNQLIERLGVQRTELSRWQAYGQTYQQRLAEGYQPLAARLRQRRVALIVLFDRTLERDAWSKRERQKLEHLLLDSVRELLAEAPDPELVRYHDKYAPSSFAQTRRDEMEALRAMARTEFGIDAGDYRGEDAPEDLAEWLRQRIRGSDAGDSSKPTATSDQTASLEARRKQAAEGGTRAVREVFRKLASELHPDRESDPREQARKTELMQRVNLAYKDGDLLGLLELQLGVEQIDAQSIAGLADERLRRYIYVLEEQAKRLRDELSEITAPYRRVVGDSAARALTPEAVQRALEADIRALKDLIRGVDAELDQFEDPRSLKDSLGRYRINSADDAAADRRARGQAPRGRRRRQEAW